MGVNDCYQIGFTIDKDVLLSLDRAVKSKNLFEAACFISCLSISSTSRTSLDAVDDSDVVGKPSLFAISPKRSITESPATGTGKSRRHRDPDAAL